MGKTTDEVEDSGSILDRVNQPEPYEPTEIMAGGHGVSDTTLGGADQLYRGGNVAAERPYSGDTFVPGGNETAPSSYVDRAVADTVSGSATDMSGEDPDLEATRIQIERTRADMSETIDAIQQRLNPQALADQARDTVREATIGKAQDMVNNAVDAVTEATEGPRTIGVTIIETIRANPVPAALAGIGIGWLFFSGRKQQAWTGGYRPRQTGYRYPTDTYGYTRRPNSVERPAPYAYDTDHISRPYGFSNQGYAAPNPTYGYTGRQYAGAGSTGWSDAAGDAVNQAQSRASDLANQAQRTAGQFADQAQSAAGQVANQVQDAAAQVADQVQGTAGQVAQNVQQGVSQLEDQAQWQVQRAQSGFQQMLEERPLAVGAAAVAVGLAVGLAIPETEMENEWMGGARDTLADRVQQRAQDTVQKVQDVAQEAVGAAKDAAQEEAQRQGLTQESGTQ